MYIVLKVDGIGGIDLEKLEKGEAVAVSGVVYAMFSDGYSHKDTDSEGYCGTTVEEKEDIKKSTQHNDEKKPHFNSMRERFMWEIINPPFREANA